jgi:hypothetical protein
MLAGMTEQPPNRTLAGSGEILPPMAPPAASWCRRRPARRRWPRRKLSLAGATAAATIGAYLASLAESHAPATIRRRLSAIGKMHRFNDLPRNAGHRDIQGPLQGLLRSHGRPARQAAALSLAMLRQLLATCDQSKRGRRDRALLLFGFAGALPPLRTDIPSRRGCRRGERRAAAAHRSWQERPGGAGAEIGLQRDSLPGLEGAHRTGLGMLQDAPHGIGMQRTGTDAIAGADATKQRSGFAPGDRRTASAWPGSASTGLIV